MSYAIVVPTYNPGAEWSAWVGAVARQSVKPAVVIVIDSSSTDGQIGSCEPSDWRIVKINTLEFDHGATRNKGFEMAARHDVDFIVSLTQDAILADPHAIERLLEPFADARVAAVCGRQLPRHDANARARFYNIIIGNNIGRAAACSSRGCLHQHAKEEVVNRCQRQSIRTLNMVAPHIINGRVGYANAVRSCTGRGAVYINYIRVSAAN